jgi:hypothetical protein
MIVQNDAEMKGFVMNQNDIESEKFWKWKNLEIFLSVDGHVTYSQKYF